MSDKGDFTSRPQAKRVRSDHDHSKGDTKDREDDRKKGNGEKNAKEDGEENKDEDWLKQAPFCVGESWDGWETKWRESCWCGKSESLTILGSELVTDFHFSPKIQKEARQ